MIYFIGLMLFIGIVISGCDIEDDEDRITCSTVGSSTTCIFDPADKN